MQPTPEPAHVCGICGEPIQPIARNIGAWVHTARIDTGQIVHFPVHPATPAEPIGDHPEPATSERVSGLDLDAIEAWADAATVGPWCADPIEDQDVGWFVHSEDADIGFPIIGASDALDEADAEFVARARTDVPALVAEVRRVGLELERLRVDYRILWGITLGHTDDPADEATVLALAERAAELAKMRNQTDAD